MSKLCIYKIPEAPYFAISSVRKERRKQCIIEDTSGRLRRVDPIYVGPADSRKILQFGTLMSRYVRNMKHLQDSTIERAYEILSIMPAKA